MNIRLEMNLMQDLSAIFTGGRHKPEAIVVNNEVVEIKNNTLLKMDIYYR